MQLVTQNDVRTKPSKKDTRSARGKTIAAIHITWAKIRRDLKGDKEELRQSRLDFMSTVLNRDVKTSRGLSQARLGKVLDAMRALESAPLLPGAQSQVSSLKSQEQLGTWDVGPETATVVHLATDAQVATLEKLFAHLGWTVEGIERFLQDKFKTKSPRMLTPAKANSCTMILMSIAASKAIKARTNANRVSRVMIRTEIPALKRRLGIDQVDRGKGAKGNGEEARYEEDDY